jgi:hypothetical protein
MKNVVHWEGTSWEAAGGGGGIRNICIGDGAKI